MPICKIFVVISVVYIIYLIECNGKESPGKAAPASEKVAPAPRKAAPLPRKAAPGKARGAAPRLCDLPKCYTRCEKKYKNLEIPKDFDNVVGICAEHNRCECHLYRQEGHVLKFLSYIMLGSESTCKAFIVICVVFISYLTEDIAKADSDELINPPYPVLDKIKDESLQHTSISDENSTTKQTTRITQTRITVTRKTTFAKVTIPYRCHRTLQTGLVGPAEIVPSHIPRPAYALNNGTELAPKFPLIKNDSLVEAINQSCSISKSVLEKLESYVREGITTEQIDTYAHELITRRGAYPSYLQFHRYPKSITTSINNIVAFGKPDNTKLRSGDIITVDIPVYYNGYHGACVETFLVEKVDFAGQKLVNAAREITYAAINCSRPGESFLTLGRVIERETKLRGYQVIPSVQGYGIGEFLREYPRIIHFGIPIRENIKVKNEAINGIMQPGMVFTVGPAITDGKPDCVSLSEESYEYQDKWTVVTMDGSRSAQFGRTVLITNDGYKILS